MHIVVTGANGFIGKNLCARLRERKDLKVSAITRQSRRDEISGLLRSADILFHLAGANRPPDPSGFQKDNVELTRTICAALRSAERSIPIIYTSSTQVTLENHYAVSKRQAEEELHALAKDRRSTVFIYRLPNVFGKWSRPNYNSAVATFCHNVLNDLPLTINDRDAKISLVHIDDVIEAFSGHIGATCTTQDAIISTVEPVYSTTVGALADQIMTFRASRASLVSERVGTGLVRALYSTYVSFMKPDQFCYQLPRHGDARGTFVEMLKTRDSGQFSFFTAHPGVTRGGHYHHAKTEKFLVMQGSARFCFRHILTGETYEIQTSGEVATVVETVPGWAHDITNVGEAELLVMLWANEIFDRARPDTIAMSCGGDP